MLGFDGGPDRVDPLTVLGPRVARRGAEGLGEVAGAVELVQRARRLGQVPRGPPGPDRSLDVAAREHFGVPSHVQGRDEPAPLFELLRDPSGTGEQIERPARAGCSEHLAEDGHDASLRAQVLDHRSDRIGRQARVVGLAITAGVHAGQ
jgi:hypothetical protein